MENVQKTAETRNGEEEKEKWVKAKERKETVQEKRMKRERIEGKRKKKRNRSGKLRFRHKWCVPILPSAVYVVIERCNVICWKITVFWVAERVVTKGESVGPKV